MNERLCKKMFSGYTNYHVVGWKYDYRFRK